ncbi:hypothetical protein DVA67_001785 [Solirubrobacter sp. CPCC 204708]|uniref:Cell division protein FtsL n=1 Tax=Solirubrobacter deserti TaxID=2282478 RepID=A0ABT4RDT7_9ACTN|nr:hypothetical protein [Solirubrobacter deserti]MBE2314688.1 hypothetical protein [Solirubrobacter deserti]MDA0136696.1 hypothetical protein [Solirubrobacter deserti]
MPSTATRSRPIHARRVSGPVRRPATAAGPQLRGRTSAFERIARIPDNRIVDRILRSRGVIWLIGIMLGGIVAMQVSLLKLNTGISRAYQAQETYAGKNAMLQTQLAEMTSAASIRTKAADMGLVDPAAGDNRYLKSRGVERDAKRAADRMKPPGDQQKMVMLNDGWMPGPGATVDSLLAAKNGTLTTPVTQPQATPTAAVAPTATVEPLPTPVATATPVPTATPLATAVPTVDPATGLAVAPQG